MSGTIDEKKALIRAEMIKKREAMSEAECTAASIAICNKLWEAYHHYDRASGVYLSYYYCRNEVNLTHIHENLLMRGHELYFPVIEGEDIRFYFAQSPSDFSKGTFDIMEPTERKLPFDESESAVCFVPGVAFSEDGRRIGFGRGYYDRFLSERPEIRRVGICYESQLRDDIPSTESDIKMEYIVTEKRIIKLI